MIIKLLAVALTMISQGTMKNEIKERLAALGQDHLSVDSWSEAECQACLEQIEGWTPSFANNQRASWQTRLQPLVFHPMSECPFASEQKISTRARKTAVLLLAGGQGSRLGSDRPKGCFPLLGKSLFQRHAEKIREANVPLAILTSRLNCEETIAFFEEHAFFGLRDVRFFSQETMPLLDETGRWFLEAPGRIAAGADGNGSVFKAFEEAGLGAAFENEGIEVLHIVPVDNPLADPCDSILSSFHALQQADLTVKCIQLADSNEPTGRIVRIEQPNGAFGLSIAEFAELSLEQKQKNLFANTGLLAIDLQLVRSLAKENFPLHWAWKTAASWEEGQLVKKPAWKAERFIVDALLYAKKGRTLCYPRENCFAPLKDMSGIQEIERLLVERENLSK